MTVTAGHLKQRLSALNLTEAASIVEEILLDAHSKDWSCSQFLHQLLEYELQRRDEKQRAKRLKWAAFHFIKTLDEFKLEEQPSLSKRQMEQLREMLWLEHTYNLILLGPPGVGKTHLSVGLGMEALERGHRVSFVSMDDLVQLLKTQEITRTSQIRMNRILKSDLVIIDDLMFLAMEKSESNLFLSRSIEYYPR